MNTSGATSAQTFDRLQCPSHRLLEAVARTMGQKVSIKPVTSGLDSASNFVKVWGQARPDLARLDRGLERFGVKVATIRARGMYPHSLTVLGALRVASISYQRGMPEMTWLSLLSYFFGGVLLANAIPHVVSGMLGRPFQSPFAKPPGEGLSSSTVNVLWGFLNIVIGYLLVCRVGDFGLRNTGDVAALGAGALLIALFSARHFGRLHGGNQPERARNRQD